MLEDVRTNSIYEGHDHYWQLSGTGNRLQVVIRVVLRVHNCSSQKLKNLFWHVPMVDCNNFIMLNSYQWLSQPQHLTKFARGHKIEKTPGFENLHYAKFCEGPTTQIHAIVPAGFSNVVHFYNTLEHIESPVRSIQCNDVDYTGYKGSLERHNSQQWCNLTKSITLSKYSGSWGFSKKIVSCCYEWSTQGNPSGWTNKQLVHGFQV